MKLARLGFIGGIVLGCASIGFAQTAEEAVSREVNVSLNSDNSQTNSAITREINISRNSNAGVVSNSISREYNVNFDISRRGTFSSREISVAMPATCSFTLIFQGLPTPQDGPGVVPYETYYNQTNQLVSSGTSTRQPNNFFIIQTKRMVADVRFIVPAPFLNVKPTIDMRSGNLTTYTATIYTGDIDDDGEIGSSDFDTIVSIFGLDSSSPNFIEIADLDWDGEIGSTDFDFIVSNFGRSDE